MTEPSRPPRLVPARPNTDESEAYMPRLPWRWILLGTMSVATVTGGYLWKEQRKADSLRSQIMHVHETELAEPARRYQEFRDKLEGWILEAGKAAPKEFVDKRLRIPGLRSGRGLYLRLQAKDTKDKKSIASGAATMDADVIASCMGLAPTSARGLWDKGEFLMPDWMKETRKDDSVMRLRVKDEMLARHLRGDLPAVLNMLRSQWFMLVIEQGENRREHPVDVFLWDVKSGQRLLSARVQSSGVLMPVRVRAEGVARGPALDPQRLEGAGGPDCSIAAKVKELAGMPLAEVQHVGTPEAAAAAAGPEGAAAPAPEGAAAPAAGPEGATAPVQAPEAPTDADEVQVAAPTPKAD